jgi:hypothetical protein
LRTKNKAKNRTPTTQSAGGFDDAADKNIGGILVMRRIFKTDAFGMRRFWKSAVSAKTGGQNREESVLK